MTTDWGPDARLFQGAATRELQHGGIAWHGAMLRGTTPGQNATCCPGSGTITAVVVDEPSAALNSSGVPRASGEVP